MFFKKKDSPAFTIGITTFEDRFNDYFKPLLTRIKEYENSIEVVVAVNGENKIDFNEQYRSNILAFLAEQRNVFPIVFPQFRGLAKLWNSIIIASSHDYILMLNDDVMIENPKFFEKVKSLLHKSKFQSFLLNRSWSHFMAAKKEIEELGFFDERLLGIGEEDGDMTWRYIKNYGKPLANYKVKGVSNFSEQTMENKPQNIKTSGESKYSLFNKDYISKKYVADPSGVQGMFEAPVVLRKPMLEQYPNEIYYRNNRGKL